MFVPSPGIREDWDTPKQNEWGRVRINGGGVELRQEDWGQRSTTGLRVAAAPSTAATTMLSCLCTSAQAAFPAPAFMALK